MSAAPTPASGWWEAYRRIPYLDKGNTRAGCGCWGLVRLIYAEQLGLDLPAFDGRFGRADRVALAEALGLRDATWVEVAGLPAPDHRPRIFDLALFAPAGLFHVGVVSNPRRKRFLHILSGASSAEECWSDLVWSRRFCGFWRHHAFA